MLRAVLCSSSGGQIVLLQHLVPSLSVKGRTVRHRILSPKEKCECLKLLLTFLIIAAHCVICKVRNQYHRWFDITQNILRWNKSMTQDRSQQCHHNALRIVRVFGCSVSLKSYRKEQRSLSPTNMTAATSLNKARQCVRSSQLLSDF